jgi:hypothetical protein
MTFWCSTSERPTKWVAGRFCCAGKVELSGSRLEVADIPVVKELREGHLSIG